MGSAVGRAMGSGSLAEAEEKRRDGAEMVEQPARPLRPCPAYLEHGAADEVEHA